MQHDQTQPACAEQGIMVAPDDTPPSQEAYNRFYALAKRIYDEKPWKRLEECQVLAVERNDAETDFVSVMGAMGNHFAVAVYPSLLCIDHFMCLADYPDLEAQDLFLELPQLQLTFDSKSSLFPGEREATAASGIRFTNGKWPSAQAFVPGYFPWKAGAKDLGILCVALEQLLAKLEEGGEIPDTLDIDAPFCTRSLRNGVWVETVRRHEPKSFKMPITLPNVLMERVRALPTIDSCFEADCYPMMTRIGKPGKRPVCPHQLAIVDRSSRYVFGTNLLVPEEGKAWSFVTAIPAFLKMLAQTGHRPAQMAFASQITLSWGEPLCDMLGIQVDRSPCDAFLEFRYDLDSFFQRR